MSVMMCEYYFQMPELNKQEDLYYQEVKIICNIPDDKHRKLKVRIAQFLHPNLKVLFFNVRMKLNTRKHKKFLRYRWWLNS